MSGTPTEPQQQLGLFQAAAPDDRLRQRLAALDVDRMTPLEALTLLAELKKGIRPRDDRATPDCPRGSCSRQPAVCIARPPIPT